MCPNAGAPEAMPLSGWGTKDELDSRWRPRRSEFLGYGGVPCGTSSKNRQRHRRYTLEGKSASGPGVIVELVAYARHGHDVGGALRVLLDQSSQAADVDIYVTRRHETPLLPRPHPEADRVNKPFPDF